MNSKKKVITVLAIAIIVIASVSVVVVASNNNNSSEKVVTNDLMNVKGIEKDGVVSFKGIPYAEAPVGELRFKAPVEKEPWTETLDCTKWGNIAIQDKQFRSSANESEDCLNLNIWAPADAKQGSDLPVYVWIHGGAYVFGSGQDVDYDGTAFAKDGVIVVTINYRLGTLGFLALDCLKQSIEGVGETTGNWGTLDQICALEWVHKNIGKFGGDNKNVTIGGESAGSFSVLNMIVSPLTQGKDLFQNAILESGAVMHMMTAAKSVEDAKTVSLNIANKYDPTITADDSSAVSKLMNADAIELMDACDFNLQLSKDHSRSPWAINDGIVLPVSTIDAVKAGQYNNVKILMGYNTFEGAVFTDPLITESELDSFIDSIFGPQADEVKDYYDTKTEMSTFEKASEITGMTLIKLGTDLFQRLFAEKGTVVYGYQFSHYTWDLLIPYHAAEIAYSFGQDEMLGEKFEGNDVLMRDCMHAYWVNFIKTGDPNGNDLSPWTKYNTTTNMVMTFGTTSSSMAYKLEIDTLNVLRPLYFPGES